MGTKESVANRRYTEEFKTEAVRLALSTGGNAAAKRLGIRTGFGSVAKVRRSRSRAQQCRSSDRSRSWRPRMRGFGASWPVPSWIWKS